MHIISTALIRAVPPQILLVLVIVAIIFERLHHELHHFFTGIRYGVRTVYNAGEISSHDHEAHDAHGHGEGGFIFG